MLLSTEYPGPHSSFCAVIHSSCLPCFLFPFCLETGLLYLHFFVHTLAQSKLYSRYYWVNATKRNKKHHHSDFPPATAHGCYVNNAMLPTIQRSSQRWVNISKLSRLYRRYRNRISDSYLRFFNIDFFRYIASYRRALHFDVI